MSRVLLEADRVTLWRGETPVLDGVSLSLAPGRILRIDGENGSGKTTLLRVLAGLVEPDEGEVRFEGRALPSAQHELNAALLYIGHRPGTCDALSAVENLAASAVAQALGVDPHAIAAALDAVGLHGRHTLPVSALSAGQRRRVALARLALEPRRLWMLDEPLTALDAQGLDWLRDRLSEHVHAGGTVLLTTHQPLELPGVPIERLTLAAGASVSA